MSIQLDIPEGDQTIGKVLIDALTIINGVRQEQYGTPERSHELIAKFWNCYLDVRQKQAGDLTGKDVALMMVLLKIVREINGYGKPDNLIDAAGYIGIAGEYGTDSSVTPGGSA